MPEAWSDSNLHHNRLGLREELTTEQPSFAPDTGVPDAAKRRPKIANEETIHPYGARLQSCSQW